jgi:hypothetical protein
MARRALRYLLGNILGVLIIVYFAFKFAVMLALWAVLGPIAFVFALFGSHAVFDALDWIIGGLDSAAWSVYNRLDRSPPTT